MSEPKDHPTFNIGITMAGAGSAGCYTAGVMDYLFEILDLWERAKDRRLLEFEEFNSLVPQHKVVIDVMGGTSAGGMTTVMSAVYALEGRINPVKNPQHVGGLKSNILYDSWVTLDDDLDAEGKKTFSKIWELDDFKNDKFVSLLNSKIIDHIAEKVLDVTGEIEHQVAHLPTYISKDLDILQVHTMLRGIPLAINFSTPVGEVKGVNDIPAHNSFEHFMASHYKLNYGRPPSSNGFLWFNPYDRKSSSIMSLTTKSTGAFPVGLKFREIDQTTFTDDYLKCVTERTIFNRFSGKSGSQKKIDWSNFPSPFNFITIDGGAINNEPFGEVLGILKSRYNDCMEDGYPKYGVIMIDPFPDEVDLASRYNAPDDLFSVIPATIETLHQQSKVKKDDMIEAASNPYYRGEIFPRKWINKVKDKFPITCSSVTAFGGFLDVKFRHYDFFLGRDNARNYFRYYFSFEYSREKKIVHPIHRQWTEDMISAFKFTGKDGQTYLPIIPDLNILDEKRKLGEQIDPFTYSIQDKPVYNPIQLFEMRKQIEKRFERILDVTKLKLTQKSSETKNTVTGKWMEKYYEKNLWDTIKGWAINKAFHILFHLTKGGLSRSITEITVKWILSDLESKQLLEKFNPRNNKP